MAVDTTLCLFDRFLAFNAFYNEGGHGRGGVTRLETADSHHQTKYLRPSLYLHPHSVWSLLSCPTCSSTNVNRRDQTKQFQMGNDYAALLYWLRWSGYSKAGHSSRRVNCDLGDTCEIAYEFQPVSCCRGIFRLPYVPDVAISAPALLDTQRDVRRGKVHETSQQRERIGSRGDFRAALSKKIQTISYFLCLFPHASTLLFGSIATSAFFLPFHTPILHSSLLAPEPSLLPRSQQLCRRYLSKGCGSGTPRVGNQGSGATGYSELMLAVFAECTHSPEWQKRFIEVEGLIGLRLLQGFTC